jgi:hypothetical protein
VSFGIDHPRQLSALRNGSAFLVGGGLGILGYAFVSHHAVAAMSWGGLLFGTAVSTTLGALFPNRGRRQ